MEVLFIYDFSFVITSLKQFLFVHVFSRLHWKKKRKKHFILHRQLLFPPTPHFHFPYFGVSKKIMIEYCLFIFLLKKKQTFLLTKKTEFFLCCLKNVIQVTVVHCIQMFLVNLLWFFFCVCVWTLRNFFLLVDSLKLTVVCCLFVKTSSIWHVFFFFQSLN